MCTELILAALYFLTIFIMNYFLFRLVKISLKNASYLQKIKQVGKILEKTTKMQEKNNNLLKKFEFNTSNFLCYFFLTLRKDFKKVIFLPTLTKIKKTQDLLILGNTYNLILKYNQENKKNSSSSTSFFNTYYFQLLENQYLR
jgi:hypothetical protein